MYKKRLIGIDIFRIILAFGVFLFHTNCNDGCSYGIFTKFVSESNLLMVSFFILSGFVLYNAYSNKTFNNFLELRNFYVKRLVTVLPVYILVLFLYKIINYEGIISFITFPAEILGLQSFFPSSLSNISPNAGTWFVSCIIICYLLFPLLLKIIGGIDCRKILALLFLSPLVLMYFVFVSNVLSLDAYHNPFIRILEFIFGMLLCAFERDRFFVSNRFAYLLAFFSLIMYILLVTIINSVNIIGYVVVVINELLTIVFSSVLLVVLSKVSYVDNKVIYYLSSISYSFYMAQVFLYCDYNFVKKLLSYFDIKTNINLIFGEFIACITMAIIFYELVEKPIKDLVNKIL